MISYQCHSCGLFLLTSIGIFFFIFFFFFIVYRIMIFGIIISIIVVVSTLIIFNIKFITTHCFVVFVEIKCHVSASFGLFRIRIVFPFFPHAFQAFLLVVLLLLSCSWLGGLSCDEKSWMPNMMQSPNLPKNEVNCCQGREERVCTILDLRKHLCKDVRRSRYVQIQFRRSIQIGV